MLFGNGNLLQWLVSTAALFAALSFHEFSHAAAATALGDDTAKNAGRLTLNPLAHLDLTGTILLLTIGFGWGKPVPYNPYNLRGQKWGPVMVGAAGPASNVLLALLSGIAVKILLATGTSMDSTLIFFLVSLLSVNVMLFVFNLIPIPPLDGSKFLLAALDGPQYDRTRFNLVTRGPIYLLILILADSFLFQGAIFGSLYHFAFSTVLGIFGLN
jgi:Zn-dependent protease